MPTTEALLQEAQAAGKNVKELAAQRLRQSSSSMNHRSDSDLETALNVISPWTRVGA